jgi:hypothetical protein
METGKLLADDSGSGYSVMAITAFTTPAPL